jgi:alcohol dehydrogenase YqhD (iron-dependent ADH family)
MINKECVWMLKKVSAVNARQNLGHIMNDVFLVGNQYLIERDGKAMAAIVPTWMLQQWEERRQDFFTGVDRIREKFSGHDEKDLDKIIKEAINKGKESS